MKKSFIALAALAVLGLSSCSDTFEPNVDFGTKTYINDYGKLIDAINDLNKTLDERLAALNKVVESGFASVKVAIDENTGAITTQTTTLKEGLSNINTTLLDGFTALNQTINANGDKMVTAINKNGEVISLQIKSTGELIQGQILTSTNEIIATMNSNTNALAGKLDGLNTALTTGLANLKLSVDGLGSKLDVTNENLTTINGSLVNLDSSVKAQTEQIGDLAAKLLEGFNKIDAQFTTLNNGIGQLQVSIDEQTSAITKLTGDLTDQLKALQDSLASFGGKLIFAINQNGQVIATAVNNNSEILSTQLVTSVGNLGDNILSLKDALAQGNTDIVEALKEYGCKCDCSTTEKIIFDQDDKNDDGTYNKVYVSPDVWNAETKAAVKGQLKTKTFSPSSKQSHAEADKTKDELYAMTTWMPHAKWEQTAVSDEEVVVNSTVEKDGVKYYECVKVNKYITFKVRIITNYTFPEDPTHCNFAYIQGLWVQDAKGGDYQGGRWVFYYGDYNNTCSKAYGYLYNIKVNLYDDATGVYMENPSLLVYSATSYGNATPADDDIDCTGK